MEEHTQGIKTSIESIIGTDTTLKRKKKTEDDISREMFEKAILTMEEIQVRGNLLHTELKLDLYEYDEKFFEVIDRLFTLHFGREAGEVISGSTTITGNLTVLGSSSIGYLTQSQLNSVPTRRP